MLKAKQTELLVALIAEMERGGRRGDFTALCDIRAELNAWRLGDKRAARSLYRTGDPEGYVYWVLFRRDIYSPNPRWDIVRRAEPITGGRDLQEIERYIADTEGPGVVVLDWKLLPTDKPLTSGE